MEIKLNKKEINLLIEVLENYEEQVYMDISKKENNFIFNLIDKLKNAL